MLKIFEVADGDYYAGETADAAAQAYKHDVGEAQFKEVTEEWPVPVEIAEERWDELTVVDVDEVGKPSCTFREALAQRNGTAGFIATEHY